jgi:hypothetical protein
MPPGARGYMVNYRKLKTTERAKKPCTLAMADPNIDSLFLRANFDAVNQPGRFQSQQKTKNIDRTHGSSPPSTPFVQLFPPTENPEGPYFFDAHDLVK